MNEQGFTPRGEALLLALTFVEHRLSRTEEERVERRMEEDAEFAEDVR